MAREIAIGVALGLVLALAVLRSAAWLRTYRTHRRLSRARHGERGARGLLASHGFAIVAEQAAGRLVLAVDGTKSVHALRADFLVSRAGRRFVAEVKTGALAPSLDHAPTRRQILEYCAAFDVDGALLVDPEAGRVRVIAVPGPRSQRTWPWLALGLAMGALLTWLVRG